MEIFQSYKNCFVNLQFFPLQDNDKNIRQYSCVFLIPLSSSYHSCVHIFAIVSTKEKFGTYYIVLRKK